MEPINSVSTVKVNYTVLETFAYGEISQSFTNQTASPMEVILNIPIDDRMTINSFRCILGAKVLESTVLEKKEAEAKYNEAVKSGDTAIMASTAKRGKLESLVSKVGYLQPGEMAMVDYEFSCALRTKDLSSCFVLDFARLPSTQQSKLESLDCSFFGHFKGKSKISRLSSRNYALQPDFTGNMQEAMVSLEGNVIKEGGFKPLEIYFKTEDMHQPRAYVQTNPRLNLHSAFISYTLDERKYPKTDKPDTDQKVKYNEKYKRKALRQAPAHFVFVLDQSGSMAGAKMNQAKEALTLFLKSLPPDSTFSVYGFGSTWKAYTQEQEPSTPENIDEKVNKLNQLAANLGGTKFLPPLSAILKAYRSDLYSNNIFLLTDGYARDMNETVQLFTKDKGCFRVNCIGIGNEVDHNFLGSLSRVTNGKFEHAEDKNQLPGYVISLLGVAVRPYISNVSFTANLETQVKHSSANVFYHDDVIDIQLISEKPIDLAELEVTARFFDPFEKKIVKKKVDVGANWFEMTGGEQLSKLIMGNHLKTNPKERLNKALKYQVLTQETAMFCKDVNENEVMSMKTMEHNLDRFGDEQGFAPKKKNVKKQKPKGGHAYRASKVAKNSNFAIPQSLYCADKQPEYEREAIPFPQSCQKRSIPIQPKSLGNSGGMMKMRVKKEKKTMPMPQEQVLMAKEMRAEPFIKGNRSEDESEDWEDDFPLDDAPIADLEKEEESVEKFYSPKQVEEAKPTLDYQFFMNNISPQGFWEISDSDLSKIDSSLGETAKQLQTLLETQAKTTVNTAKCLIYINNCLKQEINKLMVIIMRAKNYLISKEVDIEALMSCLNIECDI